MRMSNLTLLAALAVLLLAVFANTLARAEDEAGASDSPAPPIVRTRNELMRMRTSELRAILSAKGANCVGCSEKSELVDRVLQVQSQPDAEPEVATRPPSGAGGESDAPPVTMNDIDLDAILANMKRQRSEKQKMYDMLRAQGIDVPADDDTSVLEEMIRQRDGNRKAGGGGPAKAKGAGAKPKPKVPKDEQ